MNVRYRADVVGSLLGPAELAEAQRHHATGEIDAREFKRVEDRAVDEILELQEDAGVDVVTDGELRRTHFAGPILDACDGLEDKLAPSRPYYGPDGQPIINETPRSVTSKLVLSRSSRLWSTRSKRSITRPSASIRSASSRTASRC
jgi:5-methyltetrahydropteroyltriglutamate--homocysteine methyltransferase